MGDADRTLFIVDALDDRDYNKINIILQRKKDVYIQLSLVHIWKLL